MFLVCVFIKQCGVFKIYKRATYEDSTLIDVGVVPTPQVLEDGVRLKRWTRPNCYHFHTDLAKIGELVYIEITCVCLYIVTIYST